MDRKFGGVIWTDHALERLRERGIKQGDAWATFQRPDQSYKGNLHKNEEGWRYYKKYGSEMIEVVAKQNEKKEWIILTVWSKPIGQYQTQNSTHTRHKKDSLVIKILKFIFGVK